MRNDADLVAGFGVPPAYLEEGMDNFELGVIILDLVVVRVGQEAAEVPDLDIGQWFVLILTEDGEVAEAGV